MTYKVEGSALKPTLLPYACEYCAKPVISGPYYGGLNFELLGIQMAVF